MHCRYIYLEVLWSIGLWFVHFELHNIALHIEKDSVAGKSRPYENTLGHLTYQAAFKTKF